MFLSIQEWDKFTFQYVSIISEQTRKLNTEHFLFTFQYVSIISIGTEKDWDAFKQFTFQYVSIISLNQQNGYLYLSKFTFQYVSIIFGIIAIEKICEIHLHSNMFLLFHEIYINHVTDDKNLHSNMFLLFRR